MTRARPGGRGGPDRWLVSYADFVTLLLAFFTTLYAASSVDSNRLGPVAESLQRAFDVPPAVTAAYARGESVVPPVTVLPHPKPLDELAARLSIDLSDAIADKRLEIIRDGRGVVVSLPDDATFASASADVTPEAMQLIARVAETLRASANAIRIEGHTDDVPIRTSRYGSNWELSTARASVVVAFLVTTVGIDAKRLSAAGYGEFHPRDANDSDAQRARNRRVDIVILEESHARS